MSKQTPRRISIKTGLLLVGDAMLMKACMVLNPRIYRCPSCSTGSPPTPNSAAGDPCIRGICIRMTDIVERELALDWPNQLPMDTRHADRDANCSDSRSPASSHG